MSQRLLEPLLGHIEHWREAPLTAAAQQATLRLIRDSLGVALSGACIAHSRRLQSLWGDQSGAVQVWGTPLSCSRDVAAMLCAFAIHNQEFDCVHEPAVVHPMAVPLAALLCDAQARGGVSGAALLRAVLIAVEVAAIVGSCARAPMRFFRPAMCGALGASAGLAVLRGYDPACTARNLGMACSQLSGSMQAHLEGLPTLALQVAINARAALTAADLAAAGLEAPRDWLDGPYGYFALIDGAHDVAPGLAQIASPTRAVEQVSIKPFPTGRAAHGTLDVLTELLRAGELRATDVDRLTLRAPPLIRRLIARPLRAQMQPSYARLCLPYLASTCLARGGLGLADFSVAALSDPARGAFAGRVIVESNGVDDVNALAPQTVVIRRKQGSTLEITRQAILGSPEAPLSPVRMAAKLQHCLDHAEGSLPRDELLATLDRLTELDDMRLLGESMRAGSADRVL